MGLNIQQFFDGIMSAIAGFVNDKLAAVLAILPDSPFVYMEKVDGLEDVLGKLNYFLPIDFAISTLQLWLVAVAGYYLVMVILRWVKAVE